MLISHSKKFIFIHTYKVAGSSIRDALSPYCYPNFLEKVLKKVGLFPKIKSSDFSHHININELKELLPERMFKKYFKFAFVRNPWDWQVSLYHFTQQNPEHFQHELVKKMNFEEYIDWRVNKAMCWQNEYAYDKKGNLLLNYVGKMETINEDFDFLKKRLKVNVNLPHINLSKHKKYIEYYNEKTKNLVAKAYKDEIELFGYSFDGIKR